VTEGRPPQQSRSATERPIVQVAPPAPAADEARTAAPPPVQDEQVVSTDIATPAPAEDRPDRSARRRAKRKEERKIIESLDAMRQLRRQ
jgi:hypothetical protein